MAGISIRSFLFTARVFFRLFNRIEIKGRERIPVSGPVIIIVANHISNADPFALMSYHPGAAGRHHG